MLIEKYLQQFDKEFSHEGWCDIPNGLSATICNCSQGDYKEFIKQSLTDYGNEVKEQFIESLPFNILLKEKTDCIDLQRLVKGIETAKAQSVPMTAEELDKLNH